MSAQRTFMDLSLDERALVTPGGVFHLTELTRAEFVRDVRRDGSAPSTAETSAAAVAGGAVVGGVLLGPVGAVAGGLLGSTVDYEEAGAPHYATNSVQLVFETAGGGFRMDIPRDQESAAYQFSLDVQHAMKAAGGS